MNAILITATQNSKECNACVYGAAEAAEKLGVSEATIRRTARQLGVKRIAGRAVAGFVKWDRHPVPVCMPYSE